MDQKEKVRFIVPESQLGKYVYLDTDMRCTVKYGDSLNMEGIDCDISVFNCFPPTRGYDIMVDGLRIVWLPTICNPYVYAERVTEVVDHLVSKGRKTDLLFVGGGDGVGPERERAIKETYLASGKLLPQAVFPLDRDYYGECFSQDISYLPQAENIYCAANPGDAYLYSFGVSRLK